MLMVRSIFSLYKLLYIVCFGRLCSYLMVGALVCESSSPGLNPCLSYYVVFLGKAPHSYSASSFSHVQIGIRKFNAWGSSVMDCSVASHLGGGGEVGRNTPTHVSVHGMEIRVRQWFLRFKHRLDKATAAGILAGFPG